MTLYVLANPAPKGQALAEGGYPIEGTLIRPLTHRPSARAG
jgi:hypothetical protein